MGIGELLDNIKQGIVVVGFALCWNNSSGSIEERETGGGEVI